MKPKVPHFVKEFAHSIRIHDGDPLPVTLVATSLCLSGIALLVGITISWKDLLLNVAANLLILGPGLLITTVLVKQWRDRKLAIRIEENFAFIVYGLYILSWSGSELARQLEIPLDSPESFSLDNATATDLRRMLGATRKLLERIDLTQPPEDLQLTTTLAQLPDMALVERLVAHIDAIRPIPTAYVTASKLANVYTSRHFVTVARSPSSLSNLPMTGLLAVPIGFTALQQLAIEYAYSSVDRRGTLTVTKETYINAYSVIISLAAQLVDELIKDFPAPLLIKFT